MKATKMKIDINKLVANPFRDFELDPIDEHHVERLMASADDLGLWAAMPARRREDGCYEIACHHHLLEAANRLGIEKVEVIVENYTDHEMRRIMAVENLTQRGANTGPILDAVAAFAEEVSYEMLSDRFSEGRPSLKANVTGRRYVLDEGPGWKQIYAAINGFTYEEREDRVAEDPKSQLITTDAVQKAVKNLKDSGYMAARVAKAYAVVEQERAEDEARAAEVERKAEAKRQAEAEAARKREGEAILKAQREAEAKRKAAEASANDARKREAAKVAEANRKAAETAAKVAEGKRLRDEASRRLKIQKELDDKRAREAEERRKIQAQRDQETVYDTRCNQLFPDPDFAEAFRKAVTGKGAQAVIARGDQLKVAKTIVEQAKQWKKFSDQKVGTEFIREFINEMILSADADRRQEQKKRDAMMRAAQARVRVNKLWDEVKRGAFIIQRAMEELVRENQSWDKTADGDFPVNVDITNTFGILGKLELMMMKMFGGRFGIPTVTPESEVNPNQRRLTKS
jgi:DNA-binding cell septation regulator SpoVG